MHLVDDPLDAFSVHFGGGFSGMVSAPLLVDSGVFLVGDYQSAQVIDHNSCLPSILKSYELIEIGNGLPIGRYLRPDCLGSWILFAHVRIPKVVRNPPR